MITSNIGTLFEEPSSIRGWCYEINELIERLNPKIVAFSFQVFFVRFQPLINLQKELGGKDSKYLNNMDQFIQGFNDHIGKNERDIVDLFYSTGIIFESELQAPSFTAMGVAILCRRSFLDKVSVWSFVDNEFLSFENFSSERTNTLEASQSPISHHGRFRGTKSRKGYFQVKLRIGSKPLDLVKFGICIKPHCTFKDQCSFVS